MPTPKALVSPYLNDTNRYIELHKRLLAASGFEVAPLSVASLLRGGWRDLADRRTVLLFHWLETRPFRWSGGKARLSARGSVEFALWSAVIALSRARTVVFVHDHAVHDTEGRLRDLSRTLIAALAKLADRRIVHDPASAAVYRADYLPHPLYWDAGVRGPGAVTPGRVTRFSILGALRPYKRIDEVLEAWPVGARLRIAGRGDHAYVQTLRAIVSRRRLEGCVEIVEGFLDDASFDARLEETDVLLLPHADGSMLVSGAFFEAVGRVPLLLARRTPFIDWAAHRFESVRMFDDGASLRDTVSALASDPAALPSLQVERDTARCEFGWDRCVERYRATLGAR